MTGPPPWSNTTVFLGAGASSTGAAHLPLFESLRHAILRASGIEPDLLERVAGLLRFAAAESVLQRLSRAGVPVGSRLVRIFNDQRARPNAVHAAVALMLQDGAEVWTTNYDTLVEEATPPEVVKPVVHRYDIADDFVGEGNVFKIHGSLQPRDPSKRTWDEADANALAFNADQVLAGLPAPMGGAIERWVSGPRGARSGILRNRR